MSDESALLATIIAHPDEDTPRLAYADWLDEHGDPDRAAFIRVQCRLADMPPSDPDWCDLCEQQEELVARLRYRLSALQPKEPNQFYLGNDFLDNREEPFRRGFPYFISALHGTNRWTPDETKRAIRVITQLTKSTTIRGVTAHHIPTEQLAQLLADPVALQLTGLTLFPILTDDWNRDCVAFYRLVATNPSTRNLQQLFLHARVEIPPQGVLELARATTLDAVRRLTIQGLTAPKATLEQLTKAPWFARLRHLRLHLPLPAVAIPILTGVGKLPDLHTLDLPELTPKAVAALAKGKFPSLAQLLYHGPLTSEYAKLLAAARFPKLTVFEAPWGGAKNDGFAELLKADWFGRLRVLDLSENAIGDRAVKALVTHPVAQSLRMLTLGDNPFGKTGLAALATPGAFPALTTLSLRCVHTRKGTPAELASFLSALQLPTLRYLNLMGWPLGNEGAKALAANPTFAGLTRLNLDGCQIGDPGAEAIFASPYLQNLVELRMGSTNNIKTGADALADPSVMPRLGVCWLSGNIPKESAAKLRRDGLSLIT